MILTAALTLDYALPAAAHSAVGFSSSYSSGAKAMRRQVHGYFYAPCFMVGVVLRGFCLPVPEHGLLTRYCIHRPKFSSFCRWSKTTVQESIMTAQTQVTPEFCPNLAVINGQVKTTSLKIAEHFGKQHKSVVRAIQNLECSPEFAERNFAMSKYQVTGGKNSAREEEMYELTRDGFTFLAMGFTGKQAAQWKEAYILAFNRMESELQSKPSAPQPALPPTQYPFDGRLLLTIRNGNVTETQVLDRHDVLFTPDTAPSIRKWIMDYIPARNLSLVIEVATQRVLAISSASRG